jgi:very-short-patch-repair endonuclease
VLAGAQHGVVAVWQLEFLSRSAINQRLQTGRLHRIHQGVYAVGHRKVGREGRWMGAVLAYGPGALLSHQSAAALWGIGPGSAKIHVSPSGARRSRPGISAHRTRGLHPEDIAIRHGIPVTSVARTILDLASLNATAEDRLTKLIENADRLGLFDLRALERVMGRRRHRPVALKAVLAGYQDPEDTRSELERDFLALLRRSRLPPPHVNSMVAGLLVDAHWPHQRLVVELDSRRYHSSPRAFETDRIRDATLQRNGYRILRVTHRRLHQEPQSVLEDVCDLLGVRPPRA